MSNNNQQTAVEWLLNAIETKNGKEFSSYYSEFIEQAKEIQHDQMMQCYSDGLGNGMAVGQGECSYQSVADEKEYLIKKYVGNK